MGDSGGRLALGARAVCPCTGHWEIVEVSRLNEDGSFDVDIEGYAERFPPPTWHGVTRSELLPIEATRSRAEVHRRLREGELVAPPSRFAPFYWNQIRMGGRDPRELVRPVTRADTCAALGIADELDARARARLDATERRLGLDVPIPLRWLVTRADIQDALLDVHPNQPSLIPFEQWEVVSTEHGDLLAFMDSHQATHAWAVALGGSPTVHFLSGDEEPQCFLVAEDVTFFVWDLAQTGLAWRQAMVRDDPRLRRTDIGIAAPRRGFWGFFW
jgi:hypothetical protein